MSTIPTITEKNTRALFGEASFTRGQNYFHMGNIFDTQRQGMTLKARCRARVLKPTACKLHSMMACVTLTFRATAKCKRSQEVRSP
jgi:hypothetical protein